MMVLTRMCSVCDAEKLKAGSRHGIYVRDYCPNCTGIQTNFEHPLYQFYEAAERVAHDIDETERRLAELKDRHRSMVANLRRMAANTTTTASTMSLVGVDVEDALNALREIAALEGDDRRGVVKLFRFDQMFRAEWAGASAVRSTAFAAAKALRAKMGPDGWKVSP